ncbi:MAG TPA: hypothetical protein VMU32_06550 [Solirubrobacteraceae bacterium]|nr:hypothetical protein [Solirubrobacteraceae bacterium]
MSQVLLDPRAARQPRQSSLFEDHGRVRLGWRLPVAGRPQVGDAASQREKGTLNDVIAAAWEALVAGERVSCPVCGGQMSAAPSEAKALGLPVLGACADCGTSLS